VGWATVGRVVLGWAVVVVGLVAVGGCGPGPVAAPSVSASPTLPAPMASPAKPAAWSDTGEGGAAAAAVWFVRDLETYVLETNDAAEWSALSHPDCVFCNQTLEVVRTKQAQGLVLRHGIGSVKAVRADELNPLSYSVVLEIDQPEARVYQLDGAQQGTVAAERGSMLLVLIREGPDWQLRAGEWFDDGVPVPTPTMLP
jgi:hypothetical protein